MFSQKNLVVTQLALNNLLINNRKINKMINFSSNNKKIKFYKIINRLVKKIIFKTMNVI